jgi:hypothetical protein
MRLHKLFAQDWLRTTILLISASLKLVLKASVTVPGLQLSFELTYSYENHLWLLPRSSKKVICWPSDLAGWFYHWSPGTFGYRAILTDSTSSLSSTKIYK